MARADSGHSKLVLLVVSRYDDVVTVFKDAETYSSELAGMQIFSTARGMGYPVESDSRPQNIAGCECW